jgi:hypothetical protein
MKEAMDQACSMNECGKRNACKLLVGKLEEKRPLTKAKLLDNIKIDFGEIRIGWYGLD